MPVTGLAAQPQDRPGVMFGYRPHHAREPVGGDLDGDVDPADGNRAVDRGLEGVVDGGHDRAPGQTSVSVPIDVARGGDRCPRLGDRQQGHAPETAYPRTCCSFARLRRRLRAT